MNIRYIWNRVLKRVQSVAINGTSFEKPSKVEAGSTIINSAFGRYSYCGFNCTIINCEIGRFTSISDNVTIGVYHHPTDWVSTSPAFYSGRDSIPKNLASLDYNYCSEKTLIGNDVWIGKSAFIKGGVVVGNGAVIGMNSVVTHDLEEYGIYAGSPARLIRKRFTDEIIHDLLSIKWWDMSEEALMKLGIYMDKPELFIQNAKEVRS